MNKSNLYYDDEVSYNLGDEVSVAFDDIIPHSLVAVDVAKNIFKGKIIAEKNYIYLVSFYEKPSLLLGFDLNENNIGHIKNTYLHVSNIDDFCKTIVSWITRHSICSNITKVEKPTVVYSGMKCSNCGDWFDMAEPNNGNYFTCFLCRTYPWR